VIFSAVGGFSERFINLAASRRIDLWDVICIDNSIKGKIAAKKFYKLRSVARKTGVKIKIIRKRGLPFYIRTHNDRIGLIIGGIFFIAFAAIMNRFVWCISAVDSEKFSAQEIIEVAENIGLRHGVYVPGFDEEKAAREIYKAFGGELAYVKVNIKGSLAVIEFRDSRQKLEIQEKGEPSNIMADFDGVIVSDETYQGVKNISRGNAVKTGDVLISGVVEGIDAKPLYYEAKGKFTALHNTYSEFQVKKNMNVLSFENKKDYYSLIIFGFKIPLGFSSYTAENSRVYTYQRCAQYDGLCLPFAIEKKTVAEIIEKEIISENALSLACMNFSEMVYDKYKNTHIVSDNLTINNYDDSIRISAEYQCIDFIGESKPIIIENAEN
jgi:similar to stage IV sporulation protein